MSALSSHKSNNHKIGYTLETTNEMSAYYSLAEKRSPRSKNTILSMAIMAAGYFYGNLIGPRARRNNKTAFTVLMRSVVSKCRAARDNRHCWQGWDMILIFGRFIGNFWCVGFGLVRYFSYL